MRIAGLVLLFGLTACQTQSPDGATVNAPAIPSPMGNADDGDGTGVRPVSTLAFAQAACGGCHAVEAGMLSPNPLSPPFAEIVNRKGLTADSLTSWLRDAHNYPEEMDFDLDKPQVEDLAAYMLTLRDKDYEKPIF